MRQRHRRKNGPARREDLSQRLQPKQKSRQFGGNSHVLRNAAQVADCLVAEAVEIEPVSAWRFPNNREFLQFISEKQASDGLMAAGPSKFDRCPSWLGAHSGPFLLFRKTGN